VELLKKRISFVSIILLAIIYLQSPQQADAYSKHGPIYVFIDGKEPAFFNEPIIRQGTTLIEFRPVFEMLNLQVGWNHQTKTITGKNGNLSIKLKVNEKIAYVNGEKIDLSQAPKIVDGRTLVPLRFIAESSGKKVQWDGNTRMIIINDGKFEQADFTFEKNDLNQHLKEDALNGKLGPFHTTQKGKTLAEIVNRYGFPNARHDGTPSSDDIPFVLYGDYVLDYLGTKGDNYLKSPLVRDIQAILPQSITNQDIINVFGSDYEFESGMYLEMVYDVGGYNVYVETQREDLNAHPYLLSVGTPYWPY
jgi:hypothetical protein